LVLDPHIPDLVDYESLCGVACERPHV
jgi:hypothetical protein